MYHSQGGNTPIHPVLGSVTTVKTSVNEQGRKLQQVKGQNFKKLPVSQEMLNTTIDQRIYVRAKFEWSKFDWSWIQVQEVLAC